MKKILILSANPKDTTQIRLDEEVREIQSALERSRSREEFQVIPKGAVRIDDLRRALLDLEPQIVHFSGHGVGTENTGLNNNLEQTQEREAVHLNSELSGIFLEDDFGQRQLVGTKALTELFELFKDKIDCILLNACYSQNQAEAISQYIDCVIGMNRAISDNTAIKFSVGFYDAIATGRTYADAFWFGSNNINLNNLPESLIPVSNIRNSSKTLFTPIQSELTREQRIVKDDSVGGDQITVGNISGSMGIAVGRLASAIVNITNQLQNSSNPEVQKLGLLLKQLQVEIEKEDSGLIPKNRDKALKHLETIGKFGGERQNSDLRVQAETALDALPTILSQGTELNKTHIDTLLISIKENLGL